MKRKIIRTAALYLAALAVAGTAQAQLDLSLAVKGPSDPTYSSFANTVVDGPVDYRLVLRNLSFDILTLRGGVDAEERAVTFFVGKDPDPPTPITVDRFGLRCGPRPEHGLAENGQEGDTLEDFDLLAERSDDTGDTFLFSSPGTYTVYARFDDPVNGHFAVSAPVTVNVPMGPPRKWTIVKSDLLPELGPGLELGKDADGRRARLRMLFMKEKDHPYRARIERNWAAVATPRTETDVDAALLQATAPLLEACASGYMRGDVTRIGPWLAPGFRFNGGLDRTAFFENVPRWAQRYGPFDSYRVLKVVRSESGARVTFALGAAPDGRPKEAFRLDLTGGERTAWRVVGWLRL